ncbi:MAG: hemolysin family protein, partial [Lachnospiraceae bacterium]|nr:hemolysin family protein [Lachnospiraceae bacterium]
CGIIYCLCIKKAIFDICENASINILAIRYIINAIAIMLFVILVTLFGSLIPKKIARKNAEKRAYDVIRVMMFIMKALRPLTYCLQVMMNGIIKMSGINPQELNDNVTEEEIISMVTEGHEQGVFEANEVEMISNIMEFDDKVVKDIMTHRKSIVAVNVSMTVNEALKFMVSENYSRYPVYEDEIDNIIGILHVKDLARYFVDNEAEETNLRKVMRKPYFVPETQNIDVLLNDMQSNKTHMAIVIDEYGQTSGIVAFEDVLEEIVGNIQDEYDEEEKNIMKQTSGHYMMKGLTPLADVETILGIEFDNTEYDTLNGFLISMLQRIPNDGEKIAITYSGFIFEIMDVKSKMIKYVKVKPINKQ